jgi:alcohol dehydrogenase
MLINVETEQPSREPKQLHRGVMKANVFRGPGEYGLEEKPIPTAGPGEAVVQVRLTTICGTDIHIIRGEYPVTPGLTIGHEAVGVIHELGAGITGYQLGQRVLVGAITPCGQCEACLAGDTSQCQGALGGWRLGNTIDGAQAEYVRIPYAQANLAAIPDALSDEDVLLLSDIASTGFSAAESGRVRLGDTVAVFAQGPIGLCANAGRPADGGVGNLRRRRRCRAAAYLGELRLHQDDSGGRRSGPADSRSHEWSRRGRRNRSAR